MSFEHDYSLTPGNWIEYPGVGAGARIASCSHVASSADPVRVGAFASARTIWAVVETPAGGRVKYKWDADAGAYRAGRILPLVDEIEDFFSTYVERQGRVFELVGKVARSKRSRSCAPRCATRRKRDDSTFRIGHRYVACNRTAA